MAKYNKKTKDTNKTVNKEGAPAYKESPELELVSILLTSFVQDQFYRGADETTDRVVELLDAVNPILAAKMAVYARNEFGMRSISHIVGSEIPQKVKGEGWVKKFIGKVVRRPDDMTEITARYMKRYGKRPLPNNLKKGLRLAFNKFDEYQLAKYRGEKNTVSLIDLVNLVRPTPSEKNAEALKKLVAGELKSKGTWESKLTKAGQESETEEEKQEKKKESWKELIESRKIGYFALLRNLRNIHNDAPEVMDKALELLKDEKLIKKSLVLPFRYGTALREIEALGNSSEIISALSEALDISVNNVPKLKGKTLVAVDNSGSMYGRPSEIAGLFGAILAKSNDADTIVFENSARYLNINKNDSTLSIAKQLTAGTGGTNFNAIFETANRKYDRIIILSDMQGWIESTWGTSLPQKAFADYKKRTEANPVVYSFDLAGYGSLQFPEENVYSIAGFSDKVFDIMKLLETDRKALLNEIKKVNLDK